MYSVILNTKFVATVSNIKIIKDWEIILTMHFILIVDVTSPSSHWQDFTESINHQSPALAVLKTHLLIIRQFNMSELRCPIWKPWHHSIWVSDFGVLGRTRMISVKVEVAFEHGTHPEMCFRLLTSWHWNVWMYYAFWHSSLHSIGILLLARSWSVEETICASVD